MSVEDKKLENDVKESTVSPVFSDEEIRNTVKGFILAFIRKEVTVDLHAELIADLAQAHNQDVAEFGKQKTIEEEFEKIKEHTRIMTKINGDFIHLIEICSGVKPASETELKESFNKLFKEIITLRFAKKMEGSFWDYSLEYRIEKIEKKIEGDMEFLKKEIRWLKEQLNV